MTPETRSEDTDTGELFFGVDARHVRQLGQQLVGDRVTAVSELVKNAYDADASRVTIDFYNPIPTDATQDGDGNRSTDRGRSSPARLVIVDDGTGMQLSEMESGWMRISTDYKERLMLSRDLLRNGRGGRESDDSPLKRSAAISGLGHPSWVSRAR